MHCELEVGAELVAAFAHLTGDRSAIHVEPEFARKTRFRGVIVHGMLPVLLLLHRLQAEERQAGRVWLRSLACRFTGAVTIGDRLRLEAEATFDGDAETWAFTISRWADGRKATSGKAVLVRGLDVARAPAFRSAETLMDAAVEESRRTLGDLSVGQIEDLTFLPEPPASRRLLAALHRESGTACDESVVEDPTALAVAVASTMVGMRLPGRFATFLDLDATFSRPISRTGAATLRGIVADIAPTGSRMRLDLEWRQGGAVVGRGTAATMIGEPAAPSLSCAALRQTHGTSGLEGRTALITGASRGIGEATAKLLAIHGARIAVHYFRGRSDAEAIVDDIRRDGGEAVAVQADLADAQSAATLVGAAAEALGPIDILVNNAVGDFTPKPFEDVQTADYLAELGVSLFGMHACCRAVLGHMRRQRWGKIINLGTVATALPVSSQTRYIAVKSAVVGFTRSLALETSADNIQVNVVVPAMTATSLIAGLPRALVDRLAEDSPGGTILQPIDVASTIFFLASAWSGAISGQQIALTRGAPPFF